MKRTYRDRLLIKLKNEIEELYKQWNQLGCETGYPTNYQGVTTKSEPLLLELEVFSNRNVLDIGCNSGLYSYFAGIFAKSVLGCDLEKLLVDRAVSARPFFNSIFDTSSIEFYQGNFVNKLTPEVSGIIAACVLYHVGDENLQILMEFLTANKPTVVLQVRPSRGEVFLMNPDWGCVSNTKLFNGMFRIEDNLNFLRTCGYDNVRVVGLNTTSFHGEFFPILIASD